MQGKRRWRGLRVWLADADGKRHIGEDGSSVLVRQDGVVGLQVLPKAAEGVRWRFVGDNDKK